MFFLAILPILVVVSCMLFLKWGSEKAVPLGLAVGLLIAWLKFGLTGEVISVAAGKSVFIALNVLLILWAAVMLFKLVDLHGGIQAVADVLEAMTLDKGWLTVVLAWCLTGVVEGLAGFGLPMAIVGALLLGLGVPPIHAVAAAAIGNGWSVCYGSMASVFEILNSVTHIEPMVFAPYTAYFLALGNLLTGFALAAVLGQLRHWRRMLVLWVIMASVLIGLSVIGVYMLAGFIASLAGIAAGILISRNPDSVPLSAEKRYSLNVGLRAYGFLTVLSMILSIVQPLRRYLLPFVVKTEFPAVETATGFVTPAGPSYAFKVFLHPAFFLITTILVMFALFDQGKFRRSALFSTAFRQTWDSGKYATIGIIAMVLLSTIMEHTGMSSVMANGLADFAGGAYPLVAPFIGMLGTFATGSNSNSNVLFGALQQKITLSLNLNEGIIMGAQNAGGSLGSMIAPAKLVLGCSTTGLEKKDGLVLRKTLPYGLGTTFIVGLFVWLLSTISK